MSWNSFPKAWKTIHVVTETFTDSLHNDEVNFDTNESDRKFIFLERRFDVILHHFQVQLKFVIFKCS